MKQHLVISHQIFLTQQERNQFGKGNYTLEVSGVSAVTDIKNKEFTKEILYKYLLSNEPAYASKLLEEMPNGYKIYIDKKHDYSKILDIEKGGSQWLEFSYTQEEEDKITVHQVVIQDIDNLIKSTECMDLEEYFKEHEKKNDNQV